MDLEDREQVRSRPRHIRDLQQRSRTAVRLLSECQLQHDGGRDDHHPLPVYRGVNTGAYFILEPYVPQLGVPPDQCPGRQECHRQLRHRLLRRHRRSAGAATRAGGPARCPEPALAFNRTDRSATRQTCRWRSRRPLPSATRSRCKPSPARRRPAEIWSLTGNMVLTNTATGDSLNVWRQRPPPAPEFYTYGSSTAANETWTLLPYQPEPSGQYFTINSGSPAGSRGC